MLLRSIAVLAFTAASALAQEADLALNSLRQDTSLPVEVSADSLSVDQGAGTATFSGNVVIAQGELRLSAPEVVVNYSTSEGAARRITTVEARGGVTLNLDEDAAEAQEALYSVDDGIVRMSGDVLLTQGSSALSGDAMTLDLVAGTGRIEGGVRTIFQTGGQ